MRILKIVVVGLSLMVATPYTYSQQARAQEVQSANSSCATPGTVVFPNVADKRSDLLPSVHKQLSSLGRLAASNNCSVVLTCVSDPSLGEERLKKRDAMCNAAKAAMSMYETRGFARKIIQDGISIEKRGADSNLQPASVYVSLQ